ncbi:protein YIF1A isoform X4 [Hippoglossus hippoglossus]|nr:protein YIF1A isoform X4 [Hippoglossus hippoglossus]XP_034454378.1 protein YIF1A isoform X4 [Hippoglossus hippoglossus]XP_035016941.1 protein YIF1A isoform X2 [Hippoglossus stenolepis]XP_035016942.1 protein YIF1A isoform X2 [Hippoglossus stenolepis]
MDVPHHGYRATKQRGRAGPPTGDSVLFEDTSSGAPAMNTPAYYTPGYNMAGPANEMQGDAAVNNLFTDPMANAAMMYGSTLANTGKDMVNKEISRFMSVNKLKYFFAVDTRYVLKKLMILLFPYTHQDWEVRYHRDTPLTPRQDVNAPDLYIPTMAFITYILLTGMALGIQQRFSPEVLGLCASTALVWIIIEVLVMLLSLYLLTVHSDLSTFDLIAYSGYKYVGMIFTVLCGLLFGSDGYYVGLAWSSCALMFFIVRSLKMKILPSISQDTMGTGSSTKPQFRLYITVATAVFQPIIIYWLTSHLVR